MSKLFDENPRYVPFYVPLLCFLLALIIYVIGVYSVPEFKEYALIPIPLGGLTLSIYLRTRYGR